MCLEVVISSDSKRAQDVTVSGEIFRLSEDRFCIANNSATMKELDT